jgi:hypothetical protein
LQQRHLHVYPSCLPYQETDAETCCIQGALILARKPESWLAALSAVGRFCEQPKPELRDDLGYFLRIKPVVALAIYSLASGKTASSATAKGHGSRFGCTHLV